MAQGPHPALNGSHLLVWDIVELQLRKVNIQRTLSYLSVLVQKKITTPVPKSIPLHFKDVFNSELVGARQRPNHSDSYTVVQRKNESGLKDVLGTEVGNSPPLSVSHSPRSQG